ncbi:MAG: hypothetical protein AVDCRST_MAG48-3836 [uncultured Friedmanniella sp.]|uniref:Uncharacterized protein n=1 Tax=uncultured Friedmanniella sp. TaxID=335381 RepID=A0A6J4LWX3_9ACTN|nr:MAG: hypothetical protein AVDCRST_MAG48-3836 [uncultured Friedmanniella sp.]
MPVARVEGLTTAHRPTASDLRRGRAEPSLCHRDDGRGGLDGGPAEPP